MRLRHVITNVYRSSMPFKRKRLRSEARSRAEAESRLSQASLQYLESMIQSSDPVQLGTPNIRWTSDRSAQASRLDRRSRRAHANGTDRSAARAGAHARYARQWLSQFRQIRGSQAVA